LGGGDFDGLGPRGLHRG